MKFELEPYNRNISDDDLIADVRRVAIEEKTDTVTMEQYRQAGKFGSETIRRRFGSWNAALERAGFTPSKRWRIPDDDLFSNLESIWRTIGRQPRRSDLVKTATTVSISVYEQRFGSWRNALNAFVDWINSDDANGSSLIQTVLSHHRTSRQPSLRLRFRVLRRDFFRCRYCGRSPANTPGLELNVDHILAWANGGETILENLQTLCENCNFGKSNLKESNS
ncbi:MAG: HNH endonuclease [Pirellulales bacterium]